MKKIFLISLIIFTFQGVFAQTTSLNGTWSFHTDPNNKGENQGWYKPEFSTQNWDEMPVPYNWDLRNEYAHYVGGAWYRRTFTVNPNQTEQVFRLVFEGVYNDSKVWLNGKLLGENNLGYLPFEFEISNLLDFNGNNTLVVVADNTFKRGAIWTWGGIRREVKLEISEKIRIVQQQITSNVDLANKTASVSIEIFLQNYDSKAHEVAGNVAISSINGQLKSLPFNAKIEANSAQEIMVKTALNESETHLWHFEDPFLYASEVRITNTNEHDISRFGLRKIELDNAKYELKLNGESVRLMGMNLVPDDRTTGNTIPLWRFKEDVDLLKTLGCNMARITHLPLPKECLDYLDERGILVFNEIPLWGYDKFADPDKPIAFDWLKRLIIKDFNHPSVIGWGVGNEIGKYPTVMKYVEKATQYVRGLDSTRLAVVVSHTADNEKDIIDFSDLGLINKYNKNIGQVTDLQHNRHPNKILFYTEFGLGQIGEDLDTDYNAKASLDSMRFKPYLIGASYWTFNDYRSNFNGTKEFSENRAWGVVDAARQKKKAFYSFRKEQAPVKSFRVNSMDRITIIPRKKLDLPAFILREYKVVYLFKDADNKVLTGGFIRIPTIKLDDFNFVKNLDWIKPENAHSVSVDLLSPLNYSTADTTIFFQKPVPTQILSTHGVRQNANGMPPKTGVIRVVFDKNPTAVLHKIKFGKNGLTQETKPTLNLSENVKDLEFGETYQVAVVAINAVGETLSEIKNIKVGTEAMPPTIRYTEAADKGFFVGYSVLPLDRYFRVQYTIKKGNYSNAMVAQTDAKGTLFVGDLENGKPYYFRLQTITDEFTYSEWSEEKTIIPDGGLLPQVPDLKYVIQNNEEAIVCFEPVKKAIGYVLEYRSKSISKKNTVVSEWQKMDISSAQTSFFQFKKPNPKLQYEFRLATKNTVGISTFSEIK